MSKTDDEYQIVDPKDVFVEPKEIPTPRKLQFGESVYLRADVAREILMADILECLPERLVGVRYSQTINESEAYMDGYNEAIDKVRGAITNYFGGHDG